MLRLHNQMIVETILGIAVIVISIIAWRTYKRNNELVFEIKEYTSKIKSLYILHGQAMENVAPFSKNFPGDRKEINFLGKPIDFIGFHQDKIVFYEIKTGVSQLSSKQKAIRNLIEQKRVEFKELRY